MKRLLCLFLFACGSSKATTTTPIADPVPMNEAAGSAVAEPTPVEPTKPTEPTQPPAPDPAKVKADLLAAEMAAYEQAKPVFDKYCAKCHSKDGAKTSISKREHFDMTAYPFGGHHAMDVHNEIRIVLGVTGKKPTMPADKKGAVKGEELALIKAWADAFEASHKGGAHEDHSGHGGGHKH
jgi:uncharacterized membrane protein